MGPIEIDEEKPLRPDTSVCRWKEEGRRRYGSGVRVCGCASRSREPRPPGSVITSAPVDHPVTLLSSFSQTPIHIGLSPPIPPQIQNRNRQPDLTTNKRLWVAFVTVSIAESESTSPPTTPEAECSLHPEWIHSNRARDPATPHSLNEI